MNMLIDSTTYDKLSRHAQAEEIKIKAPFLDGMSKTVQVSIVARSEFVEFTEDRSDQRFGKKERRSENGFC